MKAITLKHFWAKALGLTLIISGLFGTQAIAREPETAEFKPQLRFAVMMANSHALNATKDGKRVIIIPGWGFDLDYRFHKRWSVAFQTDVKLQSFEVEEENVMVKRTFPVSVAGVIHFYPLKHWSFYTGPGCEIEKSKTVFLVKAGTEYSFEITDRFEIGLNFIYEGKIKLYDSFTFGIALNSRVWEKGQPKKPKKIE